LYREREPPPRKTVTQRGGPAALKERFGATWQVWFVPHAMDGGVTW
jgi:hypothetical protein